MGYSAFDLKGKKTLITGGNSGIGLGMAEALAAAGADVCIWGRNEHKNEKALEKLKEHGVLAHAIKCDVGDEDAVEKSFAETLDVLGRVDSCFANAGVGAISPAFDKMSTDEWRRVMRINLDGVFFTLRAAARHMVERGGGGSMAVTASLAAIEGYAKGEHYAATKGAIISMTKALSVEYARNGIRTNAIVPGWIDTPMAEPVMKLKSFQDKVLTRIPVKRWGAMEDFGGIAVYLASDASSYHTGDTIIIDGGYSIY